MKLFLILASILIFFTVGFQTSDAVNDPFSFEFQFTGNYLDPLFTPSWVAVDNDNRIIVSDAGNHRIQIFDSEGNFQTEFGSVGDDLGQLNDPYGIVVDSNNRIIVADKGNHRIQIFDSEGNFLSTFGTIGDNRGEFSKPNDIAIDSSGRMIITDQMNHRIQIFDSEGNFLSQLGSLGSDDGYFKQPTGVAVDSNDRIIVLENYSDRIQIFDSNGNFLTKFGSNGGGDGQFGTSYGIAVDSNDRIIVADKKNHRIQIFDSDGNYLNHIGSFGSDDSQFKHLLGITVDSNDRIIVSDTFNDRIQVLEYKHIPQKSVVENNLVETSDSYLTILNPRITNNVGETVSFLTDPGYDYVQLEFDIINTHTEIQSFAYGYENYFNDQLLTLQWVDVENIDPDSSLPLFFGLAVPNVGLYDIKIEIWDNMENKNILDESYLTFQIIGDSVTDESNNNESESTLIDAIQKSTPDFVDPNKDPQSYLDRYNNEPSYKEWFDSNYPDYTIEEAVGYQKVTEKVPSWVKNNAQWWVDGNLEDCDFASGIQHLVKEKIIDVSVNVESKPILDFVDPSKDPQSYIDRYNNDDIYKEWFDSNYPDYTINEAIGFSSNEIPSWVKNNAGWWAEGLLSEDDFLKSIEYLVEQQIIRIN